MQEQRRWPVLPWIPILSGLIWLVMASRDGAWTLLFAAPIGSVLLGAGVAQLLWAGDRRIPQTMAMAGVLGTLAAPLFGFALGAGAALALALLSGASFVVAGACAVWQEPHTPGVPTPEPSPGLSAKVAIDEAILGMEQFTVSLPVPSDMHRIRDEIDHALAFYDGRGWLDDPAAYHAEPPALERPNLSLERSGNMHYEHLRWESGYAPHEDEPGRERYLARRPLQTAHAYIRRHPGPDRPWLVCNDGYRTGTAGMDLRIFHRYYYELGLNLAIPVLPLHGPRRIGRQSGDHFFSGDILDTIHTEAQAMWDIRRLIGWLRAQGAPVIGTTGLSLGGYTTALLAGLEDDLSCAIAGIPVVDLSRIIWRHGPKLQLDYFEHVGHGLEQARKVMHVVSPLAMAPRVPREGRLVFAGVADRLVPPDHARDLMRHWDVPREVWYQGAHCTFAADPNVMKAVDETLRAAKLLA